MQTVEQAVKSVDMKDIKTAAIDIVLVSLQFNFEQIWHLALVFLFST